MSEHRIALKNPTGWFAAGREVSRAMALLSDGAFKVYMHVCLTADRSTGRMKIAHGDLAAALKKSRRSIVSYLEELRKQEICSIEVARNQHAAGHIEVCDPFWPYVKCRIDQKGGETLASYVEAIRQLLAARRCVKPVFSPADEKIAVQLFGEHVELKQIDHAILLACARRYLALLNGTAVGLISGLVYFSAAIQEVRALQISENYWPHVASRVRKFEQQWVERKQVTRSPVPVRIDPEGSSSPKTLDDDQAGVIRFATAPPNSAAMSAGQAGRITRVIAAAICSHRERSTASRLRPVDVRR